MVPNLATPMQTFLIIFIYFNSSFRCLLVRVSGNTKKRGHAVAVISFSFRFINFCYLVVEYRHCVRPIWCMLWPIWCGRYGCGRYGLWPISSFPIISNPGHVFTCSKRCALKQCSWDLHVGPMRIIVAC